MSTALAKKLVWKDKRPMGMIHLASYGHVSATNPSGWCFDQTINVADKEMFREKMRWWIARSLPVLKECNAQGCVIWEPEGFRYGGGGYLGSPDLALVTAPELEDGILSEVFRTYRENNLLVGCTLRGCELDLVTGTLRAPSDYYRNLFLKAHYAREVYGCRIFYVDSPFELGTDKLLSSDIFAALHREMGDCLFVPEFAEYGNQSKGEHYLWTAPMKFLSSGYNSTVIPAATLREIPSAFACVSCAVEPELLRANVANMKLRKNDIMWMDMFWRNPSIDAFKEIYK